MIAKARKSRLYSRELPVNNVGGLSLFHDILRSIAFISMIDVDFLAHGNP
jgi:hypothetical protein